MVNVLLTCRGKK